MLVWASSEGSGDTARMRSLAWTFAARIGDKYQIRLTRSINENTKWSGRNTDSAIRDTIPVSNDSREIWVHVVLTRSENMVLGSLSF